MAQQKISQLDPVVFAEMTDVFPDVQALEVDIQTRKASLLDVFTLFQPGATATITSTTTLSGPVPHTIVLAPSGADQVITFMPLTAANHARFGDPIRIINLGNFAVQLRYSDDNPIPGSVINAGNVRDYIIRTVGTPGALQVTGIFGTICNQDSPLDVNDGGTGAANAADARANLGLDYEQGVHNTNWTGIWASPLAGPLSYARLNKTVTILMHELDQTATASDAIVNTVALPASLRPADSIYCPLIVINNSTAKMGTVIVDSSGFITIYSDPEIAFFDSGQPAGCKRMTITYDISPYTP
jgi:hypothetical protein